MKGVEVTQQCVGGLIRRYYRLPTRGRPHRWTHTLSRYLFTLRIKTAVAYVPLGHGDHFTHRTRLEKR